MKCWGYRGSINWFERIKRWEQLRQVGDFAHDVIGELVRAEIGEGLLEGGFHAGPASADDIRFNQVPDEERLGGGDIEMIERGFKNTAVGLAIADGAGIDANGEKFEQAGEFEMAIMNETGDEGIGNDAQAKTRIAHGGERWP
jgi:hypothetical protein